MKYNKLKIKEVVVQIRRVALFRAVLALERNNTREFAFDHEFDPTHFQNAINGNSQMKREYIEAIDNYLKNADELFNSIWEEYIKDLKIPITLTAFGGEPRPKLQVEYDSRGVPMADFIPSETYCPTPEEFRELSAIEDDEERAKRYEEIVASKSKS